MNGDTKEDKKSYYRPPMNYSKLCEKYNMEAGSDIEQEKRQNELDVQKYGTAYKTSSDSRAAKT